MRDSPHFEQLTGPDLGHVLYEARFPAWFRILGSAVILTVSAIVALILAQVWSSSNWLAVAILTTFAAGMPFVVADMLFAWVRFHEHGILARNWRLKLLKVGYNEVTVVGRDRQGLYIHLGQGRAIKVTGLEGNFDLIEDVVRERIPGQEPKAESDRQQTRT